MKGNEEDTTTIDAPEDFDSMDFETDPFDIEIE